MVSLRPNRRPKTSTKFPITLIFAIVGSIMIWQSFANPKSSTPPLALTSQQESLNKYNPPACMSEDDWHLRTYSGYLNGSFNVTEQLCSKYEYNGMSWESGGIGLIADLTMTGTLTDMTITSPSGVAHHAVLVGTSTSGKGANAQTIRHYEACFESPFSVSSDTGGMPLSLSYPGDPWTYTLSGNLTSATWNVQALMGYTSWQQQYCPPSEQNLGP